MRMPPTAASATRLGWSTKRDGEDRRHVGDRDLGDDDECLRTVELSLLQRRQHDRRRARGQEDAVHGGVSGPRQLGHDQARERRSERGHARCKSAPSEGRAQTPVAQRDVHADGHHQHGEARLRQKRHRRVVGVHHIEAAATEDHAGEDLAGHDGHEHSPAGREQRTGQTGSHDHREVAQVQPGEPTRNARRR
jgi:hypothetical protein